MANSVEQISYGVEQRTQAPAGVESRKEGPAGKLLPVPIAQAVKQRPVGLVNTGLKGDKVPDISLDDAVARIQDYFQDTRRSLEFRLDETTGITVVSVYDRATEELIRQIPSEEAVSLAQKLNQEEPLSLFRAQV